MKLFIFVATAMVLSACQSTPLPATETGEQSNDVLVMVIGTYHFEASSEDIVSLQPGSVMTPEAQAELAAIADAVAAFKPTHVVVERETSAPGYFDENYRKYSPDMLASNPNERVQLGYRIASVAGLSTVHGIDELGSKDEPDYFPFAKLQEHATRSGLGATFDLMISDFRARAESSMEATEGEPIAHRLIDVNSGFISNPDFYYSLSKYDIGEDQPAAELQAYWFMRNAKIFSKLEDVTAQGDRVVVVYGAGHKFWIEHMVKHTPGFRVVDPVPFLEAALD